MEKCIMSENEKKYRLTNSKTKYACRPAMRDGQVGGGGGGGGGGCAKPPLGKSKEAQLYLLMGVLSRERI